MSLRLPASHEDGMSWLKEFEEHSFPAISFVAQATSRYIRLTGIEICTKPELKQAIGGFTGDKEQSLDFAFAFKAQGIVRQIALRVTDDWSIYVEDLDPIDYHVVNTRLSMPMHVNDNAANKLAIEKMLREFLKDAVC